MSGLTELEGDELVEAEWLLNRAAHDVAKYMAMTARNIDAERVGERELDLLRRDLERTDGARPAWTVWGEISGELGKLAPDLEVEAIDHGMAELASMLTSREMSSSRLVALTVTVSNRISSLRRAIRSRRLEVER